MLATVAIPPQNFSEARSLRAQGLTITQIADATGSPRTTVYRWVSDISTVAPLLTVNARGSVLPTVELLEALGIKHGSPIELVAPRQRNGGVWHLDVRPTANRRLTHTRHASPRFESGYVYSPRHFRNTKQRGSLFSRLALELATTTPEIPGYYPLKPNHALSTLLP